MSIDARSRQESDVVQLGRDELFDRSLPNAVDRHGDLAARGCSYLGLPPLGLEVGGRALTIAAAGGGCVLRTSTATAGVVAVLEADALSDLLQDVASTMGLAMSARVKITRGSINDWIRWEPVLRALYDGRKVHETGDVDFVNIDGGGLDLDRTFSYGDDPEEMLHFLEQAGFLHLRRVFDEEEMAAVGADIDEWIARANPDDGQSWWATDNQGRQQAVRVLNFQEKSGALPSLLTDDRLQWLTHLTGDGHVHSGNAEGLVKPLGIVRGLSDLPWHKDCGQGKHSYMCNSMTCGISVTGADRSSGALGVIPGSHRANTMATGRDPLLDLQPRLLETSTGDVTVHCSDTLHRAHPPVERPRKVVYTSFPLAPPEGERPAKADPQRARAARAALSDVQLRIEAADNETSPARYQADPRR
jgi:Phytanoyl-CoA dioxygenase (PhyH)